MANIILEKYFTSRIGKMYPTIFRQKFFFVLECITIRFRLHFRAIPKKSWILVIEEFQIFHFNV